MRGIVRIECEIVVVQPDRNGAGHPLHSLERNSRYGGIDDVFDVVRCADLAQARELFDELECRQCNVDGQIPISRALGDALVEELPDPGGRCRM